MKIYTPMLADSKILIAKIKNAHDQGGQKWLYIKDIDIGDKRANLGLLMYGESAIFKLLRTFILKIFFTEMCETYSSMGPEDRFEIECAPNLGKIILPKYCQAQFQLVIPVSIELSLALSSLLLKVSKQLFTAKLT